jgi:thioredoxin reductase
MMTVEVVIMTHITSDPLYQEFDVAVIGGGAAGLSAALVLARSRRAVVVIDAGSPRNAPAAGVHGFLTRDGISPTDLLALGRSEAEQYGGLIVAGEVRATRRLPDSFEVTLADGRRIAARRLVVATGLVDELPDIPGLRERWGRDVLHCPYCHGWEVRDQPVGILATGSMAMHQALLFRQLTSDLVMFTHTAPPFSGERAEELAALGIRVVPGRVTSLEVADDRLVGIRLEDGTTVARRALVVRPDFMARSEVLAGLGLKPSPHPLGIGERIAADPTGRTEAPGVWVAGNVTDLGAQVIIAAAGGATVGAQVNADLAAEDSRHAVIAHRRRNRDLRNSAASERQIASAS